VIPVYRCVPGESGYVAYAATRVTWSTQVVIYSMNWESTVPMVVDTNTFTAYDPYFPGNILATTYLKA